MKYSFYFLLFIISTIVVSGCQWPDASEISEKDAQTTSTDEADGSEESETPAPSDAPIPLALGNMLSPFNPPTLEQLDETVNKQGGWKNQEVKDSNKLLYEYLNGKPAPITEKEALELKNDSLESNEKIRHTLGRLPENEAKQVDYSKVLIRQSPVDAKSTNPILMSSSTEQDLYTLIGFGILSHTYDTMESYAPKEFVTSWQTSPDMLYDKFVMRDDILWSDGEPVTAYDIEFSFKLIMTRQIPTPAMRSGTDQIKAVVAYDNQTVIFFHKEALVTNVMNMNFATVPKHIYEKSFLDDPTLSKSEYHNNYEKNPVVAGPYKISDRKSDQFILLQEREDFYMHKGKQVRDKPYFKTIRVEIIPASETALMSMKRGDLDYMQIDFNQWNCQTESDDFYSRCTKVQAQEWTSFHICWNQKTPYFSDVRVRKAMSYAIDYKEMFDVILYNLAEPSNGIFHPLNPAYPKDAQPPYHQDVSKSVELLDQAGWQDHDGDGIRDKMIDGKLIPFDFTLYINNSNPIPMQIGELVQQNLRAVGVICNVRPIEYTTLQQRTQSHEFQAYLGGWGTGTDPDTSSNIWTTGADRNFGYYSNKEVDRLFELGKRENNREKRMALYGKIHNIIYDEQPYTFLYCRNAFYAVSKRIRGYGFYPRGIIEGGIWIPKQMPEK